MDSVKVALGSRVMAVVVARQSAEDREEWRAPGSYVDDCVRHRNFC